MYQSSKSGINRYVFFKFLLSVAMAWGVGIALFLNLSYIPPIEVLLTTTFILAVIIGLAVPIVIIIWDEEGFKPLGCSWLVLNSLAAYSIAGVTTSPKQIIVLWTITAALGMATGMIIPAVILILNADSKQS